VIFGGGKDSVPVQIDAHEWDVLRRGKVTRNTLMDISIGGAKAQPVLVQSIAEDPRSRKPIHVDFQVVTMSEEMTVDVPLVMVGTSVAVEKEGGTLIHLKESIHLKALPGDLPTSIEVDVSSLVDFETTLHVSDLTVPKGVHILTDASEPIARVMAPRTEQAQQGAAIDLAAGAAAEAAPEA
jgi:large subunit ribosomal protein L25